MIGGLPAGMFAPVSRRLLPLPERNRASGAPGVPAPSRVKQLLDFTNQRRVVIGLGHDFSSARALRAGSDAPQHHQAGQGGLGLAGEGGAKLLGRSGAGFQVEDDHVGMMAPGEFQAPIGPARGENTASAAFQGGGQDFAVFAGTVDNQHAALVGYQGGSLRGVLKKGIEVPSGGDRSGPPCRAQGGRSIASPGLGVKANSRRIWSLPDPPLSAEYRFAWAGACHGAAAAGRLDAGAGSGDGRRGARRLRGGNLGRASGRLGRPAFGAKEC